MLPASTRNAIVGKLEYGAIAQKGNKEKEKWRASTPPGAAFERRPGESYVSDHTAGQSDCLFHNWNLEFLIVA